MKYLDDFQHLIDSTYPQNFTYRFANKIIDISEDAVLSDYTFPAGADFYKGHFPGNPVTPGTILLESALQSGVVPLLKYQLFLNEKPLDGKHVVILSNDIKYKKMVPPNTRVLVTAKKTAYNERIALLRCRLIMKTEKDETILHGKVSAKLIDFK